LVILAVNPCGPPVAQEAADAGVPSLVIRRRVVEGGEAAAAMQRSVAEIAVRHGVALSAPTAWARD
jgi:hypothetical protein